MTRYKPSATRTLVCCLTVAFGALGCLEREACAQPGFRESLVRLDVNKDNQISPDEITPLARPYLERIVRSRQMSLERTNSIDAIQNASPIVMEPVVHATFTVPEDCVGGVSGDLAGMRGSVRGTNVLADGRVEISAEAPLKDLQAYHSRLKSLTGGEGSFDMAFSRYAQVTPQMAKELTGAYSGTDEE